MDYQIKYNKGLTLIELLVVIAIFSILVSVSFTVYTNFNARNNLETATDGLVEALRFAQSNAEAVNGDAKWGVGILADKFVVFKGSTYVGRDASFDQALDFSRTIVPSGLLEIVFEKMTGETLTVGTTTLTNTSGTKNININVKGTITY
jgi:prepilin-type N-terminal cleavage/methylation domain-containing protein